MSRCWQGAAFALGAAVLTLSLKVPLDVKGRMAGLLPIYGVVSAADESDKGQ